MTWASISFDHKCPSEGDFSLSEPVVCCFYRSKEAVSQYFYFYQNLNFHWRRGCLNFCHYSLRVVYVQSAALTQNPKKHNKTTTWWYVLYSITFTGVKKLSVSTSTFTRVCFNTSIWTSTGGEDVWTFAAIHCWGLYVCKVQHWLRILKSTTKAQPDDMCCTITFTGVKKLSVSTSTFTHKYLNRYWRTDVWTLPPLLKTPVTFFIEERCFWVGQTEVSLKMVWLINLQATITSRRDQWILFSVDHLCAGVCVASLPLSLRPPPVCPCSSKTSLTPPISTVGSFRSSFRPPNLSSHFPRYLLITFFPELFLWLPRHPFLSGMPLFARNVQNWIAYSAVAKDGWMDTVCGLEWWVASPLMEEKIWSVFPHQCL